VTLRIPLLVLTAVVAGAGSASPVDAPQAPPDVPAAVTPGSAAPGNGAGSPCSGSLSGAVQATFDCTVTVIRKEGGRVSFEVKPTRGVKGLKSLAPATFVIQGPITVQTYAHRDLAEAHGSAVTSAGKKFSASDSLGARGDIEVQVQSMELTSRKFPLGTVHVHAHLVPASAKDTAEIQVDVQFEATW
jgi:hypothetical protein